MGSFAIASRVRTFLAAPNYWHHLHACSLTLPHRWGGEGKSLAADDDEGVYDALASIVSMVMEKFCLRGWEGGVRCEGVTDWGRWMWGRTRGGLIVSFVMSWIGWLRVVLLLGEPTIYRRVVFLLFFMFLLKWDLSCFKLRIKFDILSKTILYIFNYLCFCALMF